MASQPLQGSTGAQEQQQNGSINLGRESENPEKKILIGISGQLNSTNVFSYVGMNA